VLRKDGRKRGANLIEQNDMRLLHAQNGKRDSTLLSSRKGSDLLKTSETGDAESSEVTSVLLL
jgi:hypothetical protein